MPLNASAVIDLHSHSNCSDGALTPDELMREAARRGVNTLALTDHDTTAGLDSAEAEARQSGVEFVPGVEFTVDALGVEIHVLGLGIDRANTRLQALCTEIRQRRRTRFMEMIARLRQAGVPLRDPDVGHEVAMARPLLARMLVQQGFVKTQTEAFERYLRKGGAGFVEHNRLPATHALEAISAAGGLSFVAHPGLYQNGDEILFEMRNLGVNGVEAWHSDHKHDVALHYQALARKLGLLVSGGADFHALEHPRARNFGKRGCPPEEYERIRAALARA